MTEPSTLYKLMTLYLLKKVNFPLSNSQLWNFFDQKGYTSYFVFQDTITSLIDANLCKMDTVRNVERYELTKEGEEALYYFIRDISDPIKEDMDNYIKENKFQLRNETGITADYYKSTNFDYVVHCEVREGKAILFEMNLSVPTEEQARTLANHWEENAQAIYSGVMKQLM